MGLDMRPMGKPKPGFEKRFVEIFEMLTKNNFPKPSFFEKLKGIKYPTKDELLQKWLENQIQTYKYSISFTKLTILRIILTPAECHKKI